MKSIDIFNPGHCVDPDLQKKLKAEEKKDISRLAANFIADHSEKNFNALMKRCSWGLKAFIFNMTHSQEDTENILSITMEHVYFKIDSFKDDAGKFSTWMYRIAHNDAVTYFRNGGIYGKINRVNMDISDLHDRLVSDDDCSSIEDVIDNDEIDNIIFDGKNYTTYTKSKIFSDMYDASVDSMNYLPDHLRVVMKSRYVDGKKVNTIAKENNISQASVKNWIRKGCSEVRKEIEHRNKTLCKAFEESKIK